MSTNFYLFSPKKLSVFIWDMNIEIDSKDRGVGTETILGVFPWNKWTLSNNFKFLPNFDKVQEF